MGNKGKGKSTKKAENGDDLRLSGQQVRPQGLELIPEIALISYTVLSASESHWRPVSDSGRRTYSKCDVCRWPSSKQLRYSAD